MTVVNEYFDYQDRFEEKYGEKTIVFMEVGSFIELYGIETSTVKKGRVSEIKDIVNFTVSSKKVRLDQYNVDRVLMAGFPSTTVDKWTDMLVKQGYSVIIILQDSHGKKDPKRIITEIVSPGINLDNTNFSNYLMSIYLEEITDFKTRKPIVILGLSVIDISTGDTIVYETYSTPDDYKYALDEAYRFIQSHSPREIILHCNKIPMTKEEILRYLEIDNITIHYNFYEDKSHLQKNSMKDEILKRVYGNSGVISPVESIGMEKLHTALISFIYLIQFTYEHNEAIIQKLKKPVIWDSDKYLVLSHNSIMQLNMIKDKNNEYSSGITSLWDILDKTVTCLGKRFLKYRLLHPLLDVNELENTYDTSYYLQTKDDKIYMFDKIHSIIKSVCDIERLHRKMAMQVINPQDFNSLDMSYICIENLIIYINKLDSILCKNLPPVDSQIKFSEYLNDYRSKIKLSEIIGVHQSNIINNFFIEGIYPEIDKVQNQINVRENYFSELSLQLGYLLDRSGKIKLELRETDKEGHFLSTTISRGKQLQQIFKKKNEIIITINNEQQVLKYKDLEFKKTTNSFKIFSGEMKQNSHLWRGYQESMRKLCLSKLKELCLKYYNDYSKVLQDICKFVAKLDYLSCIADVSLHNGYIKPIIDKNANNSYIDAVDLRHPIIEKIKTNSKYIPNDVKLGINDQNGILLYGVNAVGKSSYMKSIGLSIIMAQAGFFVPAKKFNFALYKNLFTRISSNDNIFKGQSTFAVELSELRSIFKRTNEFSLVLGDELCSGTETISGLSIVTAGVIKLSTAGSSFVFATHLHQLSTMKEIIDCKNVKNYHMETIYDEKTQCLKYNRKLKLGSGSSIYGLEVAKAMDLDPEFIDCANRIRKRIMNITDDFVVPKKSSFNSKIIIEKCSICGNTTDDIHHIEEQHLADENNMIGHFHKNEMFNLVQLCKDCHHSVHHGKLLINGYEDTTEGIKLSYKYLDSNTNSLGENKKKKFDNDQIDIIKDIYSKVKTINKTKDIVMIKHNIKIANGTIKKIVNNQY